MLLRQQVRPTSDPSVVEWEDSLCPLCGSHDEELILEAADPNPSDGPALTFPVVRCRCCGMIYTNPRPGERQIGRFYPANYRPHRRPRKMQQVQARPLLSRLFGRPCPERRVLPWHGRGRLLDFGCGGGAFLKRMADQGWQVTGLDSSEETVSRLQTDWGLRVETGTLPHPKLKPCSFDVVTMWHSLEHVHDPRQILSEAYELLVPGGKLIVACPNIDSWPAEWFGPNWFGLDLPRHLNHFSPKTLQEMLALSGFTMESMRTIRHSDWLRSSAKLACRSSQAGPFASILKWKPAAKLVALATYLFGKSDCMIAVAQRPS